MKKTIYLLSSLLFLSFFARAQHYTSVKCGSEFALALRSDSTLWGWGNNGNDELGTNAYLSVDTAVQVVPAQKWIYIAPGSFSTLAIAADSTLWGWGYNLSGQLGLGVTDTNSLPLPVNDTDHWVAASSGMLHSIALRSDGTLWATGYNTYGQLGLGDTSARASFTRIGTDADWKTVSAGGVHTLAIKNNGTLWAWGYNGVGELGNSSLVDAHNPIQIGTDTDWVAISAGFEFSLGLKKDGTIWSWGFNGNGELGRNISGLEDSIPQMIPGLANCKIISGGSDFSFVIKQDGTLWGWGFNILGQLGISTTTQQNTPVQIDSDTNWAAISACVGYAAGNGVYGSFSAGFKNTATSICTAGSNYIGQLGNGTISGQTAAQGYFDCSVAQMPGTAVKNVVNEQVLSVYPNPATEDLNMNLPQAMNGQNIYITVMDVSGKTFINTSQVAANTNKIDIHLLVPGIYFLQVTDNKGMVSHIRFVKE